MTYCCSATFPMDSAAYIGNIFVAIFNEQMEKVEMVGRFQRS